MSKQIKVKNIKPQTIKVKNTNPHIVVTIPDPDVYDEGFEAGKEAEYDRFWDLYQENGNRTDYKNGFCGSGWNDTSFKPKYDIILRGSSSSYYTFRGCSIVNLKKCLEDSGVKLDTSRVSYALGWFEEALTEIVPELDLRNANDIIALNGATRVKWIDKFILSSTKAQKFYMSRSFTCPKLEHCPFEGVIRTNEFNLSQSTLLDKESLTSVINCLAETTSGIAVTLSLQAVNKAFETSENANDGSNSTEWQTLVNTKQNWTINLS